MKIKTKELAFDKVQKLKGCRHKNPKKPGLFFRTLVRVIAESDLKQTEFSYSKKDIEKAGDGPYLILMNHSSFIDLEIISKIMYPKPYCIVTTSDGFVGKEFLMRNLGCIPTNKFVNDITLIKDMKYALEKLNTSVLMYPEASYSFDGCATPLPEGFGHLLKMLKFPVIGVHTEGAFARDPLYNCLQKRKVKVKAFVKCLASKEEVENCSSEELDSILKEEFSFDSFKWQEENGIEIKEPFRADGLDRILFKCSECGYEGETVGKGEEFFCNHCKKEYYLDTLGRLKAKSGEQKFDHIPDWYNWERECVKKELEVGTYHLDTDVDIGVMKDFKAIYKIGKGRLVHGLDGFSLFDSSGNLLYSQKPLASYGLYADYYWYEIGDVICIGDKKMLFYCFPEKKNVVAKTRLAAEELYKIQKKIKRNHAKINPIVT